MNWVALRDSHIFGRDSIPRTTSPARPQPPVSYLVSQPGQDCSIRAQQARRRTIDGLTATAIDDDERYYTLHAMMSSTETIAFAERPSRTARTVSTQDFVKGFEDELFVTSNPNGAITFFSEYEGVLSSVSSIIRNIGLSMED